MGFSFYPETNLDTCICGDCVQVLQSSFLDSSIDLIVTSPPYANARKQVYGGIDIDKYVDWFLPISSELYRVLKDDGTFVLNIKECAYKGERSTYVIELILALKKQGWLWTEDFVWYKTTSAPGKWPNRLRDAWEHCLQFNKSKKFNMYQEAVKVPAASSYIKRLNNLGKNDHSRYENKTGSGFSRDLSKLVGRTHVYPPNVLIFSSETRNRNHPAVFPLQLPTWFIKLFTKEGDTVLDPFCGSGTTLVAAKNLKRHYVGIDLVPEYCEVSKTRLFRE
jgi:site-specific DNA-methyltransferase (adenine-specific)/site-specific DNA-methyltransferase (cytosine-N4-specific)